MAIDSKQKRYAIMNFGGDADILPPADGSFDKTDRLMLIGLYVYADSAIPVTGGRKNPLNMPLTFPIGGPL